MPPPSEQHSRPLRLLGMGLLTLVTVLAFTLWSHPDHHVRTVRYGTALALLFLLSIFRYLFFRRPGELPLDALTILCYFTNYSLSLFRPMMRVSIHSITPSADSEEAAMGIALVSAFGIFLLGILLRWLLGTPSSSRGKPLSPEGFEKIAIAHWILGSLFQVLAILRINITPNSLGVYESSPLLGPLTQPAMLLIGALPFVCMAMHAMLVRSTRATQVRLLIAVLLTSFSGLRQSMLSELLMPIAGAVLVYLGVRGRLLTSWVVAGLAIFLILQPIKNQYRLLRYEGNQGSTFAVWQQSFADYSREEDPTDNSADRLNELSSFAYVIDTVPTRVNHLNGEVYQHIPTMAIPRVLWPDKPDVTALVLNATAYYLELNQPGVANCVAVPAPAHGYTEHGFWGAIFFSLVHGLIVMGLGNLFARFRGSVVASVTIIISFGIVVPGVVQLFGAVVQYAIAGVILTWLCSSGADALGGKQPAR